MQANFSVAIDGPSGAGKSTIARAAARRFGFLYVDTGAIYRTVGLAVDSCGIGCGDEAAVKALLPKLDIALGYDDEGRADRKPQRRGRDRAHTYAGDIPPRVGGVGHAQRQGLSCWTCSARWPRSTERYHGRARHRHRGAARRRLEDIPHRQPAAARGAPPGRAASFRLRHKLRAGAARDRERATSATPAGRRAAQARRGRRRG